MRHWAPWIEDAVANMVDDGVTHAVSLVLAPHYSRMSVGAYQQRIAEGLDMAHGSIEFIHVASYHDAPGYIEALARRVRDGIAIWPDQDRDQVHTVFSAHSLPSESSLPVTSTTRSAGTRRAGWPPARDSPMTAGRGATSRPGAARSRGSGRRSRITSERSQATECVMC